MKSQLPIPTLGKSALPVRATIGQPRYGCAHLASTILIKLNYARSTFRLAESKSTLGY
jgi:hypothetical protein